MFSFEDYLLKLLTNKELKVLKKRFTIVQLLRSKLTYRQIAQKLGISTTTAIRLNQRLKIRRPKLKLKKLKLKTRKRHPNYLTKRAAADRVKHKKTRLPWKIG